MPVNILAFSGSLRQGSFNSAIVKIAAEGAGAAGANVTVVELRDFQMPLFNQDLESQGMPEGAARLKKLMHDHHGFLIASPEHNSALSAALKNAIDWISRAPGKADLSAFTGKVAGLCSASPSGMGGLRGLVSLRTILGNIGVHVLPQQATFAKVHELLDASGKFKDPAQGKPLLDLGTRLVEVTRKIHG